MRTIAPIIAACILAATPAVAAGPFDDIPATRGLDVPDGWTWQVSGRARVIDGDTLELRGVKIRLYGIDAPEMDQVCEGPGGVPYGCGVAAKVHLETMIGPNPVICFGDDRGLDRYGRQVAICHVANPVCLEPDGTTKKVCLTEPGPPWSLAYINSYMVGDGWALAYRAYSARYVGDESGAEEKRRGMWAGRFVAPWDWRKRTREI